MKTITNLEQVSGGKVTLSYCLNGDIMVECSSHKDEFSFGDFEHLPRGTFTNTGYFGTDGGFFLAEKGRRIEVTERGTGISYFITPFTTRGYYPWSEQSTSYIISTWV